MTNVPPDVPLNVKITKRKLSAIYLCCISAWTAFVLTRQDETQRQDKDTGERPTEHTEEGNFF